ncbi:MAG: hypothetical protein Q4F31_09395 [Eubacteriales bacterium]|nr:hypothetical protein [Eubacteriales bacterium]
MAGPSPKTEYSLKFEDFSGGLNIRDMEYNLKPNESPDMKNLLWRNGLLASRKGQRFLSADASLGQGHALYSSLWHGHLFAHIGTKLYAFNASTGILYGQLATGLPATRGTFFMYGGSLYYKTAGAYKVITAAEVGGEWTFTAANVTPYVPVIVINASPSNGAGDIYQPENRLSPRKTVWYNAVQGERYYHLPVKAQVIISVEVDGQATSAWSYSPATGILVFDVAPPVTDPPTNNTVRITYSLQNSAFTALNSCRFAQVYGGTGSLVVVMAGYSEQPNAYFWSGNSNIEMDPGYFPMEHYQLAGETNDPITGFGCQQSNLIIFQEHQVGKALLGIIDADLEGGGDSGVSRLSIDLPYTPINNKIGCLYPWSIQLIQNNLVWAGSQGVYVLLDTTDANENYIRCISDKINGTPPGVSAGTKKKALLYNLSRAGADEVCSADDEHRYYITCNGVTYAWDYDLSNYKDPSWFLLSNTNFLATSYADNELYFLDSSGRVIRLQQAFEDFGRAIERYYRIGSQYFESYDQLKNINYVNISLGADYESNTTLTYYTDYGSGDDPTNLQVLTAADYEADKEPGTRPMSDKRPAVFRRRPMCRRVLHFSMQLRNANMDEDLALVSAEILFNRQGRLR